MANLQAGAARACITPHIGCHISGYFDDRIAVDILDDTFAKAIVLDSGDAALAIVVLDLIAAGKDDLDRAKARAEELTGIPAANILISCTHTHYGPAPVGLLDIPKEQAYMEWAMDRAADAVKCAQFRLQPCRIAHISGECAEETHNRRWLMADGTVRMNPGFENLDMVRPAGPTDPEIALLAIETPERVPIAALANYSLHYVGGPYHDRISADYFGAFDRALQRLVGRDFVAIMANGCCGDTNNCDFLKPAPEYPYPFYQAERVGNVVASRAYGAWQRARDFADEAVLASVVAEPPFTRREPTAQQLADATALLANPDAPHDMDYVYARELMELLKQPVQEPTRIHALRIGDLGLVGLPGEIFVEYGLQIKAKSPAARTMTIELADDYVGYCPTDAALEQGGYETWLARSAKAAPGTEGLMVGTAVALLDELFEDRTAAL
jgi:neutral ceramidase